MAKREPKKIGYAPEGSKGLGCPTCGCNHFITKKTIKGFGSVERYRACRHCDRRIHTKEVIDTERTGV